MPTASPSTRVGTAMPIFMGSIPTAAVRKLCFGNGRRQRELCFAAPTRDAELRGLPFASRAWEPKIYARNPCSRSAAASDWPAAFQVKFFARAADAAPSRAASARSAYTRRICAAIDSADGSAQWPV